MMTRDQAERLVERLVDKTLSKGCVIQCSNPEDFTLEILHKDGWGYRLYKGIRYGEVLSEEQILYDKGYKVLGHPIILTDVLEKLIKVRYDRLKLVRLWEDCGFTKSLQDIMLDGQFDAPRGKTVPSAPHELFEYLLQLFPERVSTECTHPTASLTKPPKCFDCGEVLGEIL